MSQCWDSQKFSRAMVARVPRWIPVPVEAPSSLKEWVGVGMFGAALCCGIVFLLWMVCRLRTQTRRDKVVIAQALAALEQGASTDIWLSMLKQ